MHQRATNTIQEHMDRHFGPALSIECCDEMFEVVRRHGPPGPEVATWTTRGMSRHEFRQKDGTRVCFEVVVASYARFACHELPASLSLIGATLVAGGAGPRQHEILTLPFEIPGSTMRCALVYPPTMWDDDAGEVVGTDVPTFIAWIIPLSEAERVLVATRGVSALESFWEDEQVDVLDLGR